MWLAKLAKNAVYVAEQVGKSYGLTGPEKLNLAIKVINDIATDWGMDWLIKILPQKLIVDFINSLVKDLNVHLKGTESLDEVYDRILLKSKIQKFNDELSKIKPKNGIKIEKNKFDEVQKQSKEK